MFSRFDTILECDRHTHTDRHTTTVYTALSIASRGKNENVSYFLAINAVDWLKVPGEVGKTDTTQCNKTKIHTVIKLRQ